jgi:hypothetical protein
VTNSPIDNPRQPWLRNATKPVTAFFDQRFTDLHEHLDHRLDEMEARLERIEALVTGAATGGAPSAGPGGAGATASASATADELLARVTRFSEEFAARAERIAQAYEELLARARDES